MSVAFGSAVAEALRRSAHNAVLAPSIHNTQPWTFVVHTDAIDVVADTTRALRVLDPRQRQLTVSCGCALLNIRATLAAAGLDPVVHRLPDPSRPELLARVTVGDHEGWHPVAALEPLIAVRRTNRRAFLDPEVPAEVVHTLVSAAHDEDVRLFPVVTASHRHAVARLAALADSVENADDAYRAELAAWTTTDPRRPDGVQASTVPLADGGHDRDELPLRTFDTRAMGWLPPSSASTADQCLLLFWTLHDRPLDWLRTGEALERVWLELTRLRYGAGPLTQAIEVRATNLRLRQELALPGFPQLLLRVGRAPDAGRTPRRDVGDVVLVGEG